MINGDVLTWENFFYPVLEKYLEKDICVFWKSRIMKCMFFLNI